MTTTYRLTLIALVLTALTACSALPEMATHPSPDVATKAQTSCNPQVVAHTWQHAQRNAAIAQRFQWEALEKTLDTAPNCDNAPCWQERLKQRRTAQTHRDAVAEHRYLLDVQRAALALMGTDACYVIALNYTPARRPARRICDRIAKKGMDTAPQKAEVWGCCNSLSDYDERVLCLEELLVQ